jgi:RNA polymerase sigma-70 factor (ECF subfamily)
MKDIEADFEKNYVTYYSRLLRFASEYVNSKAEAENIVHDVFAELWEMRAAYRNRVCVISFVYVSVKNKCIDFLRRKSVEREAHSCILEAHQEEVRASYDSLAAFNQNILTANGMEEIIENAVNNLPDKCREIFIKHKWEGKKQKDIAEELGISTNTVESQMGIAFKKLRKELKKYL